MAAPEWNDDDRFDPSDMFEEAFITPYAIESFKQRVFNGPAETAEAIIRLGLQQQSILKAKGKPRDDGVVAYTVLTRKLQHFGRKWEIRMVLVPGKAHGTWVVATVL